MMKSCRNIWSVTGLVLLLGNIAPPTSASPEVNVELKTSFDSAPYLIELLETAAEENATSYFPLLDRIALGIFDQCATNQALYNKFLEVVHEDGHITQPDALSTFQLALSIHSAAPRIEAHYQFYNTSVLPLLASEQEQQCESWVHVPLEGKRYCSSDLSEASGQYIASALDRVLHLPFDRILGDESSNVASFLYADLLSPSFRTLHQTISRTAKEGKTSYRVRYKPTADYVGTPIAVSGYGVDLSLKRTDYIVIDDRRAEDQTEETSEDGGQTTLDETEVADLRPLSSSELLRLGVKSASFVLNSEDPLDILLRLSQDFPKHSATIAYTNASSDFLAEHVSNRDLFLPPGYNVLWINGVQIMPRDIDAYALLEHLRRERRMINSIRELGLSGPQAISLLSHKAITEAQVDQEPPRYDWRDDAEGGTVIIWLNDIEKDKRYDEWPRSLSALLQRTYPGQLPPVRKEVHNLIVPIDFADSSDVSLIVDNLQNFVKRKVPIKFGLVPRIKTSASADQTRIVYHLLETYGIGVTLTYLEKSLLGARRKFGLPSQTHFDNAVLDRKIRRDQVALPYQEVLGQDHSSRFASARAYLARLGADEAVPPIFVNGVPVAKTDEWLQMMSSRVSMDSRQIQQAVFEEYFTQDSYLPELFLAKASSRRNTAFVPEDEKQVRHVVIGDLDGLNDLPSIPANEDSIELELVHLLLVADFDSEEGLDLLVQAVLFCQLHDNVQLSILHKPADVDVRPRLSAALYTIGQYPWAKMVKRLLTDLRSRSDDTAENKDDAGRVRELILKNRDEFEANPLGAGLIGPSKLFWNSKSHISGVISVHARQHALLLNGRVVGPMPSNTSVSSADFESLLAYERKKRLLPASAAIRDLQLEEKASNPLAFARISNLIALSLVSDVPEGIFEAAPTVRTSVFTQWNSSHSAIKIGDNASATIELVASIDPASEVAQRWIPILKVLSELSGVYTRIFLNPRERLEELPIKRFYRHVLDSTPSFDQDGSLRGRSAHFTGLPADALLNMGMDLPPSWLVAPKESIHDLDNIKLSAMRSETNIHASYALEHILIEGHSHDVTLGPPPRGAQLVLGTAGDTHFADTIIMANLGYFQFKANPGFYNLTLQKGRSEQIFHIDSAGSLGYKAVPGDENTEIALMSFRGTTLFPRVSRKPGMEDEDVLEAPKTAVDDLADRADAVLSQVGLSGVKTGKYLSAAKSLFSSSSPTDTAIAAQPHADINIFSVASGHLYERMLNIMMLSVMKHTHHTVKFWFIEQFLSPSFKSFLPHMAAEYGFKYELVTYKWPHWLRGQKEKQREIWGYKILFLDVLFPLDLDKVIFVDADQIVRTDMYELVQHDLKGAPYGFTPMCDSRTEMEGFRFWKQGYWKNFLRGLPYHISALYVVDLKKFRQIAAGDRLRQQYHQLSQDPNSLSNLDQDLPNHMQMVLPIHSLPQEWLWCETWCSDESLKDARTIDLCNNPQTKEPKLDRARRQVPEWTVYDEEIAGVAKRVAAVRKGETAAEVDAGVESDSVQEQLQREDAERERGEREGRASTKHDEL